MIRARREQAELANDARQAEHADNKAWALFDRLDHARCDGPLPHNLRERLNEFAPARPRPRLGLRGDSARDEAQYGGRDGPSADGAGGAADVVCGAHRAPEVPEARSASHVELTGPSPMLS